MSRKKWEANVMVSKPELGRFAYVLSKIIKVSLKASGREVKFGLPCSYLIEQATLQGIAVLANEIVNKGEFKLNGCGLKLVVSISPEGTIWALISGDEYHLSIPKDRP